MTKTTRRRIEENTNIRIIKSKNVWYISELLTDANRETYPRPEACKNNKFFVVWWTYDANYSEPVIVLADTPQEAFNKASPQFARTTDPALHKYAVETNSSGNAYELVGIDGKMLIGARR